MGYETFHVRIHGEQKVRTLTVKTGKYMLAAVAAPAILGLDIPVDLEIWCDRLLPDYGPYHYRLRWNKFVQVEIVHLVPTQQS
jgi:hypothetical protein